MLRVLDEHKTLMEH